MEEDNENEGKQIRVVQLLKMRTSEIHMTQNDVKKKYPLLASQKVPFHMRRRTVNHNIKRMPRKIRENLSKEILQNQSKKTKRPSRKYRRRASNLLTEYVRRQRDHVWLETHIWYAKRFFMEGLWGYKLPVHSMEKGVRAAYRAVAQNCQIQDMSYMICIEIEGRLETILKGLSRLTNSETGLTFAAKSFLSGLKEGNLVVYRNDCYPSGAICPVTFFWKPDDLGDNSKRTIWLWSHPAAHDELLEELTNVFSLDLWQEASRMPDCSIGMVPGGSRASDTVPDGSKPSKTSLKRKRVEKTNTKSKKIKLIEENKVLESNKTISNPKYVNKSTGIVLKVLKDELCRYRLIGPLSQSVLSQSLRLPEMERWENAQSRWTNDYYASEEKKLEFEAQKTTWERFKMALTAGQLPASIILGLTVRDPRMEVPYLRKEAELKSEGSNEGTTFDSPPGISSSPIWDPFVRKSAKETKMTQHQINQWRRNANSSSHDMESSKIPLLLVQRPGMSASCFTGGWDVICPSGFGMALWVLFIYRGARAAGLRDVQHSSLEAGLPLFPYDYPDSQSGKTRAKMDREQILTKHFRYPPDKRPNFEKLGVLSPFFPLWNQLIAEWCQKIGMETNSEFYVVRNKKILKSLSEYCSLKSNKPSEPVKDALKDPKLMESLVLVKVSCVHRGNLSKFASLSMPTLKDANMLELLGTSGGEMEKRHPKTVNEKQKTRLAAETIAKLPDVKNLLGTCDRELVGYVVNGGYSYSQGKSKALGFVSYAALLELIEQFRGFQSKIFLLAREQDKFSYTFVNMEIFI